MKNYQTQDTYEADLFNESTNQPRREIITEIQCREKGGLLCYADPSEADFIVKACNNHYKLIELLGEVLDIQRFTVAETLKNPALSDLLGAQDKIEAVLKELGITR